MDSGRGGNASPSYARSDPPGITAALRVAIGWNLVLSQTAASRLTIDSGCPRPAVDGHFRRCLDAEAYGAATNAQDPDDDTVSNLNLLLALPAENQHDVHSVL